MKKQLSKIKKKYRERWKSKASQLRLELEKILVGYVEDILSSNTSHIEREMEKIILAQASDNAEADLFSYLDNQLRVALRKEPAFKSRSFTDNYTPAVVQFKELGGRFQDGNFFRYYPKKSGFRGADVLIHSGDYHYSDKGDFVITLPSPYCALISTLFHQLSLIGKGCYDYLNKFEYFGKAAEMVGQAIESKDPANIDTCVNHIIEHAIGFIESAKISAQRSIQREDTLINAIFHEHSSAAELSLNDE